MRSNATQRVKTSTRITALIPTVIALSCASSVVSAGLFDALSKNTAATKTEAYNFSSDPASQKENYVDLSGGKHFGEIKKLAIMNYNIEFTAFKEASNSRSSSSWSQNSATGIETRTTTTHSEHKSRGLPMLDHEKLQAMVDKSYNGLAEQLKGMGIEIVSYETLKAMPEYQNFKDALHESPWVTETKDSNSIFVAPTGMPLYMDNLARATAMQGMAGMFHNTNYQEMKMIFALKDTALMSVNMVVDFATVQADKSFLSHKVDADLVHHLQAKNSSFRFMGYGQPNWIRADLKQHLVSDQKFWQESQEGESEKKQGLSALMGSFNKTEDKNYLFDMSAYYARSEDMMLALQRMFMSELAGYRKSAN